MTDELDFSLDLSPLPSKDGVSLSEAMQFLRYGGVLKVRYKGDIPAEQIEKGHLTVGSDGHYLLFVHGRDDALFGPHRSALETAQSLMLAAHDLPNQPDAYETLLQQKLNEAARSRKLQVHGLQVDEPLCLAPSPARPRRAPSPIDAKYFHIDRCFDDEYGRIHYVDPADGEAMEDDLIASLVGDPMHSYSNVTLDREGLLALAAELSPDLAYTERDAPETVAAQVATPKKRGPNFKYDWQSFDQQLQLVWDHEGAINPKVDPGPKGFIQARLEELMTEWCALNWGVHPVESMIRKRVSAFLAKAGN